jgi:hypothetical protein
MREILAHFSIGMEIIGNSETNIPLATKNTYMETLGWIVDDATTFDGD